MAVTTTLHRRFASGEKSMGVGRGVERGVGEGCRNLFHTGQLSAVVADSTVQLDFGSVPDDSAVEALVGVESVLEPRLVLVAVGDVVCGD